MNSKEFTAEVCAKTGRTDKEVEKLLEALNMVIGETLFEGNSVMLPGIGTFSPEIQPETIMTEENGERMMFPPVVSVKFEKANSLLSRLKK